MATKASSTSEEPQNRRETGRASGGRFRPGRSGNPGGRPKGGGSVREMMQAHSVEALDAVL